MPSQKTNPVGVLTALAGLLSFSVLSGVLVTAMVAPALAVTSMTANASIGLFEALPDYMEIGQLSQKNVLYGTRSGQPVKFAEVYKHNREEVSWEQVSPLIKKALVAGEDRRFYEHGGVDAQSIIRAAIGNLASDNIDSGASTLAMQLVKNINIQEALLLPDEDARKAGLAEAQAKTLDRKLKEAKLAIGLEKNYTKNQIMLAYLNITGFGGNTYGIQSASKEYFGKPASDVTLAEAASLVAIVQLPNTRNLDDPEKYQNNKNRRDIILKNMLELGMVTKAEFTEAYETPIEDYVNYTYPSSGCTFASTAKTFCDYILKSVTDLEMLGTNKTERQENWDRGGYSVYTTINLDQQDNAQANLDEQTPADETRFELGSVAVSTEVGTGRILVMAQNKIFNDTGRGDPLTTTAVNFATDRDKGGSSGFQPGSTYKIFTLADWLANGRGLSEIVNATPREFKSFPSSCDGGTLVMSPPWKPKNFGGETGPWTVLRATTSSVNIAFVSMAQQLDLCQIRDTATSMGVHRADGAPLDHRPASVLGSNEIAPLTMALAVGTVASGGLYCGPIAIDKIVAGDGTDLGGQSRDCRQALTPDVAAGVAYAMQTVINGGTATTSNPRNGVPVLGKTGTTDKSNQTWMLGSSSRSTLAVWVGNIVGKQSLHNIGLPGGTGANARHRIFKPVMTYLTEMFGGEGWADPPASMMSGNAVSIPSVAGQSVESVKALLESLGFIVTVASPIASGQIAGTVAGTNPEPGSRVGKGYDVVIYPSDGSLYIQMPNLIGNDASTTTATLVSAGFSAGNISYSWVSTADPLLYCKVKSTSPAPGAGASTTTSPTITVYSDSAGTPPAGCSP